MDSHARLFRSALLHGLGRSYGPVGYGTTNCVRLVADILDDVIGPLYRTQREDILISHGDPTRPWSGIEALIELGHREVPLTEARTVHVCQRWLNLTHRGHIDRSSRGHAFLFVTAQKSDLGMVIEATNRDHLWAYDTSWSAVGYPRGSMTRLVALDLGD